MGAVFGSKPDSIPIARTDIFHRLFCEIRSHRSNHNRRWWATLPKLVILALCKTLMTRNLESKKGGFWEANATNYRLFMNESFAELRCLLNQSPNRNVFADIFGLFDEWSESDTLELGLGYARTHLAAWSDELLSYPDEIKTLRVSDSPALHICKCLSLRDDKQNYKDLGKYENLRFFSVICAHLKRSGSGLLRSLATSQYVSQVRKLDLRYCQLELEDLEVLASSKKLSRVESLQLTGLRDDALPIILESRRFQRLQHLHLRQCHLSQDAQDMIIEALPNTDILF